MNPDLPCQVYSGLLNVLCGALCGLFYSGGFYILLGGSPGGGSYLFSIQHLLGSGLSVPPAQGTEGNSP